MTIEDQPAPVPQPDRVPVWDLVVADYRDHSSDDATEQDPIDLQIVADMLERDKLGRARYGTPLTTGNGRDHLVDAYQEALDLVVYLRAWLEENPRDKADGITRIRIADVRSLYSRQLRALWHLRWVMSELAR